ncbi:MAG: NADH-Ubiquinone/plastoquinone (complex I), various chains family protein [Candidatus Xenolissoclinum pacificiensis L6]|uniref:NADH-quinone oxidoreductase subunit N n=1 Tax=Candidatus Xenolissoclinum pacificiensis L6 TaxID=1401685 RepID=W2V2B3_9RICK|nr:MAG: NADH-Ubiquinone/plastoquinone (complex I), various chains family protein [Candidatus Xenolissoclinum pacificiensis L6]
MTELVFMIPELSILILTVFALFMRNKTGIFIIAFVLLGISIITFFMSNNINGDIFLYEESIRITRITQYMKVLCLGMTSIFLIFSMCYSLENGFVGLILLALLGVLITISSNNFIILYLSIEIQSLASYALVALNRRSLTSSEAVMKYFVLGALSSVFIVYGISVVFIFSQQMDFIEIAKIFYPQYPDTVEVILCPGLIFGLLMILIGLSFKVAIVPLHNWIADVYEGANILVTTFISSIPKVSVVFIVFILFNQILSIVPLQGLFFCMGVLSIFIGTFSAIKQDNIKRLLAYSSIVHMGYMYSLLGAGCTGIVRESSILFYISVYSITNLGVFMLISRFPDFSLEKIKNIKKTNPYLTSVFTFFILSMAGFPPLPGFFIKLAVLQDIVRMDFIVFAFLILIGGVISMFYYLYIIKSIYFSSNMKMSLTSENKGGFLVCVLATFLLIVSILILI